MEKTNKFLLWWSRSSVVNWAVFIAIMCRWIFFDIGSIYAIVLMAVMVFTLMCHIYRFMVWCDKIDNRRGGTTIVINTGAKKLSEKEISDLPKYKFSKGIDIKQLAESMLEWCDGYPDRNGQYLVHCTLCCNGIYVDPIILNANYQCYDGKPNKSCWSFYLDGDTNVPYVVVENQDNLEVVKWAKWHWSVEEWIKKGILERCSND